MPWYIYVPPKRGMQTGGLLGPYTGMEARDMDDKIQEPHVKFQSVLRGINQGDKDKLVRQGKELAIREVGYEIGSKRSSRTYQSVTEDEPEVA